MKYASIIALWLFLVSVFCYNKGRVKPGNKMEKYLDKCDTAVRQGNYSFKLLIHLSRELSFYIHKINTGILLSPTTYQVEKNTASNLTYFLPLSFTLNVTAVTLTGSGGGYPSPLYT